MTLKAVASTLITFTCPKCNVHQDWLDEVPDTVTCDSCGVDIELVGDEAELEPPKKEEVFPPAYLLQGDEEDSIGVKMTHKQPTKEEEMLDMGEAERLVTLGMAERIKGTIEQIQNEEVSMTGQAPSRRYTGLGSDGYGPRPEDIVQAQKHNDPDDGCP